MVGLLCIEQQSNCLAKPSLRSMIRKDRIDEPMESGQELKVLKREGFVQAVARSVAALEQSLAALEQRVAAAGGSDRTLKQKVQRREQSLTALERTVAVAGGSDRAPEQKQQRRNQS